MKLPNDTPPRDNQDAFNRVWTHFVVNGATKCAVYNQCYYRQCGSGCAVGCMLPDRLAIAADEGDGIDEDSTAIESVAKTVPLIEEWFSNVDLPLLTAMQEAHDSAEYKPKDDRTLLPFTQDIEENLRSVAQQFKLTVP